MSEFCPLSDGPRMGLEIPAFCQSHCVDRLDLTSLESEYDTYPTVFNDECEAHKSSSLVYSSEGLQSVDRSSFRLYAIVDECEGCGQEYGETGYMFNCPYQDPNSVDEE